MPVANTPTFPLPLTLLDEAMLLDCSGEREVEDGFEPPELSNFLPVPTSSAGDLQSVLFGAPPTAASETASTSATPWTLPIALPTQPSPAPALSTHAPVQSKVPLVAGYYPDWAEAEMKPEDVDFSRLDWVDFGGCYTT